MDGLLIGRFQPFHLGHLDAVMFGLSKVENLWIGIGSSNKHNESRNPFSVDERREMIISSIEPSIIDSIVPKYDLVFTNDEFTQILFEKHKSKVVPVPLKEREKFSGTNVRQLILDDKNWQDLVPKGAQKVLEKIKAKERLKNL